MAVIAGKGLGGTEITSIAGGTSGRDYFDLINTVTTDANAESVDIELSAFKPTNGSFKIKFWRPSGANYLFLGQTQLFTNVPQGVNTNLTFNTPISVQSGDISSIWMSPTNGSASSCRED